MPENLRVRFWHEMNKMSINDILTTFNIAANFFFQCYIKIPSCMLLRESVGLEYNSLF